MKINEVEQLTGITKKNIRFYEAQGLLAPDRNAENGYRVYGDREVQTLKRIKMMRKLGVPIEDIRRMLNGTQTVADAMRRHLVTLERSGALFKNKQKEDVRIRYVAPIAAAIFWIGLMCGFILLMSQSAAISPEDASAVTAVPILLCCGVGIGVLIALFQRIREIEKGEEDDARQY